MKSGISKSQEWQCHDKRIVSTFFYDKELKMEGWYNISSTPVEGYFEIRKVWTLLGFLLLYEDAVITEYELEDFSSQKEVDKVVKSLQLSLNLSMMDDRPIHKGTRDIWGGGF